MIEITSEVLLSLFDTLASVGASEVGFAAREKTLVVSPALIERQSARQLFFEN